MVLYIQEFIRLKCSDKFKYAYNKQYTIAEKTALILLVTEKH